MPSTGEASRGLAYIEGPTLSMRGHVPALYCNLVADEHATSLSALLKGAGAAQAVSGLRERSTARPRIDFIVHQPPQQHENRVGARIHLGLAMAGHIVAAYKRSRGSLLGHEGFVTLSRRQNKGSAIVTEVQLVELT